VLSKIALVSFSVSVFCFLAYHVIGSKVDAAGVLREPFGLIPIGYLALGVGLLAASAKAATLIYRIIRRLFS